MWRKGIRVRKSNALCFRDVEEGDRYSTGRHKGEPMPKHYCVFVRLRDCPVVRVRDDGVNIVEPKGVRGVPISGHSRSNMAYGTVRTDTFSGLRYTPVYWAEDGRVFVGRIWSHPEPQTAQEGSDGE